MKAPYISQLICLIFILLFLTSFYIFGSIYSIFFCAAVLAFLLYPFFDFLKHYKVPKTGSALIVVLCFMILLALFFIGVAPKVVAQIFNLLEKLEYYFQWAWSFLKQSIGSTHFSFLENLSAQKPFEKENFDMLVSVLNQSQKLFTFLLSGSTKVFNVFNSLLFIPFLLFYFLRDGKNYINQGITLFPQSMQKTIETFRQNITCQLRQYVYGQCLVSGLLAIYYTAALFFLNFPYALLLGLATGIFSFIPYITFLLSLGLGLVIQLSYSQNIFETLIFIGIYSVGQLLESFFLTPYFIGKRVHLSPVLILLSVLAAGSVLGFWGVIFALPLAIIIREIMSYALVYYKQSRLYKQK